MSFHLLSLSSSLSFFFFNDPPTTAIYTLSLHDALPIYPLDDVLDHRFGRQAVARRVRAEPDAVAEHVRREILDVLRDRKSTRLNSSHMSISYAVFCLKKKKKKT